MVKDRYKRSVQEEKKRKTFPGRLSFFLRVFLFFFYWFRKNSPVRKKKPGNYFLIIFLFLIQIFSHFLRRF